MLAVVAGLGAQSEYHDGFVRFSDGDVDFLAVEPGTSLNLGLSGAYPFGARIDGYATLWFGTADARYIEKDNVRPDVGITTTTIDLGASYHVLATSKLRFLAGGGLAIGFQSVDDMTWDGRRIAPSTSVIGLHGLGVLDVSITPRTAFRALLRLGLGIPRLSDFENELARAEGEASADVDSESRTDALLAVGVAISL